MNEIATTEPKASISSIAVINTGAGFELSPQSMAEVVRFAEAMARADIALPAHCRNKPGVCMAIVIQAMKWEFDPFAVANKSYSVNDRLAYESQLIAAVVNTRSGIKGRLKYEFNGDGPGLTCTVTGTIDGDILTYTSPNLAAIHPKNSPLWKSDPQQQLGYYSARAWARRHTPEVLLGVYDREEVEQFRGPDNAKDVSPGSMADRYRPRDELDALNDQGGAETSVRADVEQDAAEAAQAPEQQSVVDGDAVPEQQQAETRRDASGLAPDVIVALWRFTGDCINAIAISGNDGKAAQARVIALKDAAKADFLSGAPDHVVDAAKQIIDGVNDVIKGSLTTEELRTEVETLIGPETHG